MTGGKGRTKTRYYGRRKRNLPDREARCQSRYVRAEHIETVLVEKLRWALADPAEILSAYNHLRSGKLDVSAEEIEQARQRVSEADSQIRRLARLARVTDIDEAADAIAEEMKAAAQLEKEAADELTELLRVYLKMLFADVDTLRQAQGERSFPFVVSLSNHVLR